MELLFNQKFPSRNIFWESWNISQKEYMHSCVHSSIIYNSQDLETAQVPASRWVGKTLWCIYTMDNYMAIKKEELLPFATAWMDLDYPCFKMASFDPCCLVNHTRLASPSLWVRAFLQTNRIRQNVVGGTPFLRLAYNHCDFPLIFSLALLMGFL